MIRLVIFDLDGTLVNSSVDITNALNFAIEPYDIERMTVESTISLVGEGVTRLVEKMLGEKHAEIRQEVLDRFVRYYSEHLSDFTQPYPGVRETLANLSGCRKAVLSNKRKDLSVRLLEELGLAGHFDLIFGSDSAGEKKPSPKPVLLLLDTLGVKPQEAMMVGDSDFDIQAGKAAGVRTVAVSYGFRKAALLRGADYVIDSITELPLVVEQANGQV